MMTPGHVLIGVDGVVVGMDAAFCDIMRTAPEAMRGRHVLDVTAPADRDECAVAIQGLRDTGRPFVITKRFVRDDGTVIWVRNDVSITTDGDARPMVMATIAQIAPPATDHDPAALLGVARFLVAVRRDRTGVCDRMLFSEPGWDTVLAAYIAEAEGRRIDVAMLAAALNHPAGAIARWVKALVQHDVLEIEYALADPHAAKAYRLTAATHRRLEAYLARVNPFEPG